MNSGIIHIAFLIVSIVLFILAAIPVGNGRMIPAGLAFLAASFLV